MGIPCRRPPRHTGDAARHAPRGTSSSGRAEPAVAAAAAPEQGPPGASEGGTAAPAGAPDDGSVTVHDQVVRYQVAGAAVPPELLAAPNMLLPHLHTDHAASGHASPHAPGGGGGVSEPDARYSDVLSEAMKSADGGVWDLKRMYCSPLFFSAPTFSPGGEASPIRPVLLFPAGKSDMLIPPAAQSVWVFLIVPPPRCHLHRACL